MAQSKPQTGLLPTVTAFGAVAAPLTLALTGTFYMAGWGERERSLREFGLSADHFSASLQSTLARGYMSVLAVSLILLVVLGASYVTFFVREARAPRQGKFAWFDRIGEALTSFGRWNFYLLCALAALAGGAIAGQYAGRFLADQVKERIASGCRHGCFAYETADRRVVGVLIAEDSDSMAVFTGSGVAILAGADLLRVTPYRPGTPPVSAAAPLPAARR